MARTDRIANTWDAPAGLARGVLGGVVDQAKNYNDAEIGILYNNNINTVKFVRNQGYVMWGQKTAQRVQSALDRINVRRLLIYIENTLEPLLLSFLFELNTDKLRSRVTNIVDNFMRSVKSGDGVTAYQVVCNDTNNSALDIDNHLLNVDLYVQPAQSIEFIQMRVTVTRTGVSFQ